MKLSTAVEIGACGFGISHDDKILSVGSCFSQNMAARLTHHGFTAMNPFGAIYNPMSIEKSLALLESGEPYPETGLFEENESWHSYDFHSDYSDSDKQSCLHKINACIRQGHEMLEKCTVLLITLGTSYCYRLKSSGETVANCHKSPAASFERFFLPAEDSFRILDKIAKRHHNKHIVLTVSPIRHLKDGLHANQLSKGNLLIAADKVCEANENCFYFPSYEIVTDELRDYRFYAPDMVHLSQVAIDYVWERFSECFFDEHTKQINREVADLRAMENHRVQNPGSMAARKLQEKIKNTRAAMLGKYKNLNL